MNCPKCGSKLDTGYNCTKCDYRYCKIEDAIKLLSNAEHAPQESHIFDKFGNYLFPTDIKMESPNDACGTIMTVKFGTKEEVKEKSKMKEDELKCKYCGNELVLGGSDHDLEDGCYHTYWACKKCRVIAIENVRYGNRVNIEWVEEEEENAEEVASKDARTGGGLRSPWEEDK